MTGIKNYFRNLWRALAGRDPYQTETDWLRSELDLLKEEYAEALTKVWTLEEAFKTSSDVVNEDAVMIKSLQQLVENQRDRIREKDELISQMEEEHRKSEKAYKERIAGYSAQIAAIQDGGKKPSGRKRGTKTEKKA